MKLPRKGKKKGRVSSRQPASGTFYLTGGLFPCELALTERPQTRVPSADTVLRGIEELATGQLTEGRAYDVDFDHQFLEADKYDSKRTYKGFDGYSPGVFTIGGLIAYLENRDGNANVRFMQAETHRRFFEMMRSFGIPPWKSASNAMTYNPSPSRVSRT